MKKTMPIKSLFEKEMHKTSFRKKFIEGYAVFQIEVQLLNELEKSSLIYLDFLDHFKN